MFKFRNLLATGIALVMLAAFMIPLTAAQPAQQATATPEATIAATETPEATMVATAVSPTETVISTPSTLPTTGSSDGGAAILGLVVVAVGALMVVGAVGLVMSRRTR
jgi:hypothetical protein